MTYKNYKKPLATSNVFWNAKLLKQEQIAKRIQTESIFDEVVRRGLDHYYSDFTEEEKIKFMSDFANKLIETNQENLGGHYLEMIVGDRMYVPKTPVKILLQYIEKQVEK